MIRLTSGRRRRSSCLSAAAGTVLLLLLAFAVPLEAQKPAKCNDDNSFCVCQRFDSFESNATCPEPPTITPVDHFTLKVDWVRKDIHVRYDLELIDPDYTEALNFIYGRTLVLSNIQGTSMLIGQVGAVKLSDFTKTVGGVLTDWPSIVRFGIVGFTANSKMEKSFLTQGNVFPRPNTPQKVVICSLNDITPGTPCENSQDLRAPNSIRVHWDEIVWRLNYDQAGEGGRPASAADYYVVEVSTDRTTFTPKMTKIVFRNSCPSPGLYSCPTPGLAQINGTLQGATYYARVAAYSYFAGFYSDISPGIKSAGLPSQPGLSGVAARTFQGKSSVYVTWIQPTDTGLGNDTSLNLEGHEVQISASNVFDDPVATKTIISASDLRSQNFLVRFLVADAPFLDSSSAGYYLRARARNVLGTGPYSAVVFTGEFSVFTACLAGFYMQGSEGSGTCEPCPAFASSPSGSEDIAQCKCTIGYTGPDGQLCTECGPGKYKDTEGNATCTQCPRGDSLAGSTAASDCKCDAGQAGVITSTGGTCTTCQKGTYSNERGASVCTPCAAGTFSASTGSTQCDFCPSNSWSIASSVAKADCLCQAGYSGPNGETCAACEAGTYKNTTGSNACSDCGPGRYQANGAKTVCNSCIPFSSSTDARSTVCRCNAGYARVIDSCQLCVPGKFAPITAISCVDCVEGKYADRDGATGCQDCAKVETVNTATSPVASTAASQCICEKGYSGSINVSATPPALCQACAPGKFTASTGNSVCSNCPANSTTPPASTSQGACTCKPGYGGDADASNCVLCAAGEYKSAGNGYCMHCDAGTYALATGLSGQTSCTSCGTGKFGVATGQTTESSCMACAHNSNSPSQSTAQAACTCNAGYSGDAGTGTCTACEAGKFKSAAAANETTCEQCPAATPFTRYNASRYNASCGCALNWAYNGSACEVCPDGKIKGFAGIFSAECVVCPGGLCDCQPGYTGESVPCSACSAGTYKSVRGSAECSPCPLNSNSSDASRNPSDCTCNPGYTGVDGGSCLACSAGKYKPVNGSAECSTCPLNTTSSAASRNKQDCKCNPGYTGVDGGPCLTCSIGKYKPVRGSVDCSTCPLNTNSSAASTNQTDCKCNPGYTGDDGGPCSACRIGKYKPVRGSVECSICPLNTNSSAASTNQTDCKCNPGYTGADGGTCLACSAGKYKPVNGSAECSTCPLNTNSSAASIHQTDCKCNPGYTGVDGGPCLTCSIGKYKPVRGSVDCSTCPFNTNSSAASTNQTDCKCNPGYTGADGGTCLACSAGKYKSVNGSAECSTCPLNTISPAASSNKEDCKCSPGYAGGDGGPCEACSTGTYRPVSGSLVACCPLDSSSAVASTSITDCKCNPGFTGEDGGACRECLIGEYKATTGSGACSLCPPGSFSKMKSVSIDACGAGTPVIFELTFNNISPADLTTSRLRKMLDSMADALGVSADLVQLIKERRMDAVRRQSLRRRVLVIASDPTSASSMTQKAILVSNAVQKTLRQSGLTSLTVSASGSVIVTTNANSSIISQGGGTDGQGTNLGLIIGLSVGGFVFLIGGLVFFCRRVQRAPLSPDNEGSSLAVVRDNIRHHFQPDVNVDVPFLTHTEPSRALFNNVTAMDHDGRSLVHLDTYDSHGQLQKDALPAGWKASKDQNGNLYYYNKELKVTQWNHPGDSVEQSPPKRNARAVSAPTPNEGQLVYAPTVQRPLSATSESGYVDRGYVERGYVDRGYFPERGRC